MTEPTSLVDHAIRYATRYTIYTRDQGMRPDEAVMKALEEKGTMDCVDVEELVESAMRDSEWRKTEQEKKRLEKC